MEPTMDDLDGILKNFNTGEKKVFYLDPYHCLEFVRRCGSETVNLEVDRELANYIKNPTLKSTLIRRVIDVMDCSPDDRGYACVTLHKILDNEPTANEWEQMCEALREEIKRSLLKAVRFERSYGHTMKILATTILYLVKKEKPNNAGLVWPELHELMMYTVNETTGYAKFFCQLMVEVPSYFRIHEVAQDGFLTVALNISLISSDLELKLLALRATTTYLEFYVKTREDMCDSLLICMLEQMVTVANLGDSALHVHLDNILERMLRKWFWLKALQNENRIDAVLNFLLGMAKAFTSDISVKSAIRLFTKTAFAEADCSDEVLTEFCKFLIGLMFARDEEKWSYISKHDTKVPVKFDPVVLDEVNKPIYIFAENHLRNVLLAVNESIQQDVVSYLLESSSTIESSTIDSLIGWLIALECLTSGSSKEVLEMYVTDLFKCGLDHLSHYRHRVAWAAVTLVWCLSYQVKELKSNSLENEGLRVRTQLKMFNHTNRRIQARIKATCSFL